MYSLSKLAPALAAGAFFVTRASAQVTEAWATAIPIGPGTPIRLSVGPAGSIHLFGWGGTSDSAAAALDLNGGVQWTNRFDGDPTTLNSPVDQIVDPAGYTYVVCNENNVAPLLPQIALLKYASDGTRLWTSLLAVTNAYASQLALDSQGRILVAGSTVSPVNDADFLTVRCDTNGTALWMAHYSSSSQSSDWAPRMAVDGADNVYVAGASVSADPDTDFSLVKYNSSGQQVWVTRNEGLEYPVAIQADSAGNTWVSGYSFKDSLHPQVARLVVMRYAPSGQLLWTEHYSRAPGESVEAIASALDDLGNLWVACATYGDAEDVVLLKFDPLGNRQWAARYNGARNGSDHPSGLALDSFGNAYITGGAQDGSNSDTSFFTLKFDPFGNRLWNISRPSDSPYDSYPAGTGLDAGGGVYIAGAYYNSYEDSGWLAVKYVENLEPGAPMVLPLPASQVVQPGGTATFIVTATGDGPLNYQWRYNGRPISRATNATLTLENVTFEQRGGYSADVRNAVGAVATSETELIVMVPPTITRQPASPIAFRGTDVSFSVAATGLEPFNYQWRSDGTNVAGATDARLILYNVQPADAGGYSVIVANGAGSITSQTAILTVSMQVTRSWAARYDGPAQGAELSPLLALDGAGLPVFTAASQGLGTDFDFATLKYDLGGAQLWTSQFNSASNAADFPAGLFVDPPGHVYVTGTSSADLTPPSVATVKYDIDGNPVWSAQATNHEWPSVVTADPAGNAYVASRLDGDVVTRKYDVNGNVAWTAQYSDSYNEQPCAIALDPGGNVCVGIRQFNAYNTDLLLVKYDPGGAELWRARYDGDEGDDSGGVDTLLGMGLDAAGNIYLAGEVFDRSAGVMGSALAVVKFGGDGTQLWVVRHRFPLQRRAVPVAFTVNAAGYSWLAFVSEIPEVTGGAGAATMGAGVEPESAFHAVAQFSPDGHERWVAILSPSEMGSIRGLAADNASNSYVASTLFQDSSGADIGTSRIDPNGNFLWTALYNGPANGTDNGNAIAVGASGEVFVAGTSANQFGNDDVVLLKYQPGTAPGLPAIAAPPGNTVARLGSNVTFTVTASGNAPLRYQWLFNGAPMASATNASLIVATADNRDVGYYTVEVRNSVGTVRSAAARLETVPPPVILQQPVEQSSVLGGSASFTVSASGVEPLAYQWFFNGMPVAGGTNATLVLENLQSSQAGSYYVIISDVGGTASSQPAPLVVSSAARQCGTIQIPPGGRSPLIRVDAAGNLFSASMGEGITKRDAAGQIQWSTPFPGLPLGLALGQDGSVYVTGYSNSVLYFGAGQTNLLTRRYDANGNLLWSRLDISGTLAFYLSSADYSVRLQVDPAGNAIVLDEAELRKFAPNGSRLWTTSSGGIPIELELDAAGNIYVSSVSGGVNIVKRSPAGAPLWTVGRDDMSGFNADMAVDAAGNVYLTSYPEWLGGGDLVTAKHDTQGNELWVARYPGPSQLGLYGRDAIAVDSSGHVYVSGTRNENLITVKYDPAGQRLWGARRTGAGTVAREITPGPAGELYVTSFSPLTTIKYGSNGTQLWIARSAGPLGDAARIAVQTLGGPGEFYASTVVGTNPVILKYCDQNRSDLPRIDVPPQSQSVVIGTTVAFSVVASGTNPLSYQWRFNGLAILGATGSTLLLPNVQPANAGGYSVEVFNPLGSVVSAEVALSVHMPASITSAPADQCVMAGTVARFQVSSEGESPITYQWSFAGLEIPGATNDVLIVSNAQPGQAGIYTVRASNPFGGAAANARLSLLPNVQQLWSRFFDNVNPPPIGGSNLDDFITVSAMDSAGNLYVGGSTSESNVVNAPNDVFIVKYDTGGTLQWVAHHPATNNPSRRAGAIAVSGAGEIYLAIDYTSDPNAPALVKHSSNGQLLWGVHFDNTGLSETRKIALDSAGNAYLVQLSYSVTKVSSNGARLWTAARPQAFANDLALDAAGNVYVAGGTFVPSPTERPTDYLTVKYNTAGVEQWSRNFRGPGGGENVAGDIAVDSAGDVIVTGIYAVPSTPPSTGSHHNIATFKYDPDGNVIWFADYGAPDAADGPIALKLDTAGNAIITGYAENFENDGESWVTLKYDAAGDLLWARGFSFGPSSTGAPAGLAVDTGGNAYVSGVVRDEEFQAVIATVKYGPVGDEVWTARFKGLGLDGVSLGTYVVGVHVDAQGHVLVAGATDWPQRDAIVLAYSQLASPDASVILSQPQDVTVPFHGMAQFSVTASNAIRYQWSLNNRELLGATNATLVIPAADWNHEGRYAARVENDTYCVVSRAAQLTLNVPVPILAGQGFSDEGYFYCFAVVTPGRSYRFEASTDLVNWATVSEETANGRIISFYDSASPWQSWRFYRVVESE